MARTRNTPTADKAPEALSDSELESRMEAAVDGQVDVTVDPTPAPASTEPTVTPDGTPVDPNAPAGLEVEYAIDPETGRAEHREGSVPDRVENRPNVEQAPAATVAAGRGWHNVPQDERDEARRRFRNRRNSG